MVTDRLHSPLVLSSTKLIDSFLCLKYANSGAELLENAPKPSPANAKTDVVIYVLGTNEVIAAELGKQGKFGHYLIKLNYELDDGAYHRSFRRGQNNTIVRNFPVLEDRDMSFLKLGFYSHALGVYKRDDWKINRIWIQNGRLSYYYDCDNCSISTSNHWIFPTLRRTVFETVSLSKTETHIKQWLSDAA